MSISESRESDGWQAQKAVRRKSLIADSFFPDKLAIDHAKVYPMLVMATMSSGKSTLINAIMGNELLPNRNEACTAKVYSILDDDTCKKMRMYITDKNGAVACVKDNFAMALEKANENDDVESIFIQGQVKGVLNTDKALLVIDTPGPNNSRDKAHEAIAQNILKMLKGGLIIYVINATQLGITDDRELLKMLKEFTVAHKNITPVFVVNKVDQLDMEKESLADLLKAAKEYLEHNGFLSPDIIPVSALAALLFKKVLNGDRLTRSQKKEFRYCYELFAPQDFSLKSYAVTEDLPDQYDDVVSEVGTFKVSEIRRAIENTGITYLESYIQRFQILSGEKLSNRVQIRK
ncbi:MAG: dynamin family protein [Roseburia sp.]|nr:dynamin family protein [Roseburia sp.]MCM1096608.1 dynamin family protein [Ruminococcus flavefaciens]